MKVIKIGKLATKQITCSSCESILEYTYDDIVKQDYCYEGGKCGRHKGYKELITCPICNKSIEVGKHETAYTSSDTLKMLRNIDLKKQEAKEKLIKEAEALGLQIIEK